MVSGMDGKKEFYHCHRGSNLKRNEFCPRSRITLNLIRHSDKFTGFKEAIAPVLALAMFKELQENEITESKRRELAQLESRFQKMQIQKNEIRDKYAEGKLDFESFSYLNAKLKKEESEIVSRISKLKGA